MSNPSIGFLNSLRNAKTANSNLKINKTPLDSEQSISQISTQVEEHNKEIDRLKKDNMKLNDYSRAWLTIKVAATIAVLSLFLGFHYRIDNLGTQVNNIHRILKGESPQSGQIKP